MATSAVRYDHPAYTIRQVINLGATASTTVGTNCQTIFPHDVKLHRMNAVAVVAGTATTNTLTVRNGTTSIGLLTLSDSAAGFEATTGNLDSTISQGDELNLLKGADATGTARVTAEISVPVGTALTI